MKIKLMKEFEYDAKYLCARVGARYWEDSTVNGVEDVDGTLIPCRDGDYWCPIINIETGRITNWEEGKKASIHYKSCDNNLFSLCDDGLNTIAKIEGYVIDMMCPEDEGFGDYVIMDIDEKGFIKNWNVDLRPFQKID